MIALTSCRATEWPFWLGFVFPFALLYTFDWIMFAIIITSIMKQRCASSRMNAKSKLHRENLIVALSLAVVFGLGWGFGLLVTSYPVEEVTITFQVLFSVFVGAQGALLFLLHGVRNPDARWIWKGCATFFCGTARHTSMVPSSSLYKNGGKAQAATNLSTSSGSTMMLGTLPQKLDLSTYSKPAEVTFETKMDLSKFHAVSNDTK